MTEDDRIKLEPSWKHALRDQFEQPYMAQLREFLRQEHAAGKEIYPPGPLIFNALNSTPLDKVKVVILGQDPYHGPLLMLNTTMTVERANANAHAGKGWQFFTDRIIEVVSEHQPHLVFLLWGAHAQGKQKLIDATKHLVLTSVHPSPLSAYRGFLGCGHFSRTNKFLEQNGETPIEWRLPPV
ncbi:uracil-DNA glycosylase [Pseudomonas sp. NZIPFR-PS2]|nr:uracil-DNA glycosylase [Pseudomonas sp. NZIPFR-PS2]